ncbi:MAG: SH3 domain-containing protein [Oculatellaceae cyanobacterium Prado106]|nr:SH3 domain-containing protein [Oculatellaceae cyanobacterium Prado106]
MKAQRLLVSMVGAIATSLSFALPSLAAFATLTASFTDARINVRQAPSVTADAPDYGVPGDRVEVTRCVQDLDNRVTDRNWCLVRFESGVEGWVRSDFLVFDEEGE